MGRHEFLVKIQVQIHHPLQEEVFQFRGYTFASEYIQLVAREVGVFQEHTLL